MSFSVPRRTGFGNHELTSWWWILTILTLYVGVSVQRPLCQLGTVSVLCPEVSCEWCTLKSTDSSQGSVNEEWTSSTRLRQFREQPFAVKVVYGQWPWILNPAPETVYIASRKMWSIQKLETHWNNNDKSMSPSVGSMRKSGKDTPLFFEL